jgi:predicted AAA+ superfamily ATPase
MLSDRIIALIQEFNPWWEGKAIEIPKFHRTLYETILKYLPTKQIIAIIGLRRVGKTILMKQVLNSLPDKNNILFFSFDGLISQNPEILEDILRYFLKLHTTTDRKYIFLDEIHIVTAWEDILKRFYDLYEDIKFIISGSSSLSIKKSKESLAGRLFDLYLPILTFREFLGLNGLNIPQIPFQIKEMRHFWESQLANKEKFESLLSTYIYQGAFPEIIFEKDELIIKNYVKNSVIETILLKDMPLIVDLRKPDLLLALLEIAAKETGEVIEVQTLTDTLAVNFQTIKTYLYHLQNAFIIDLIYNYSGSLIHEFRKNKKTYIAHPSLSIATMRYSREILRVEDVMGHFVETVVYQHVKLLFPKVHFWRTPQKEEVDFICEEQGKIPIEVKYRMKIETSSFKPLLKFLDRNEINQGYMLTKNQFESKTIESVKIDLIPVWVFLCCI